MIAIGDTSQHSPKFFCQSFAAVFSPNFFTTKVFYCTVVAEGSRVAWGTPAENF